MNIWKKEKIRVRIAPSPTGALHIGTARSALFNYLFAKKNKGSFILRIEDTDLERSDLKWTQDIIDGLKWLGIEWDEGPDIGGAFGPYKQTQRIESYTKYLEKLLGEDKAYFCFCSSKDLEEKRQEQMTRGAAPKYDGTCAHLSKETVKKNISEGRPSVIRFRMHEKKIKFKDLIRGEIEFDTGLMGDIVIAKDTKTPLYNFAVVVDDYEMQISHVIRGEDHIANTPKQMMLQDALSFKPPAYAHIPLILAPDRSKMSKRYGSVSISDYKNMGYLPEAVINFMALLGWNPGTEKEIFSLSQLEKEFSLDKVQKAGAVFNIQRLDFINGYYIREKSDKKVAELCLPYLMSAGLIDGNRKIKGGEEVSEKKLEKIIQAYKARLKKLSEIVELADFFFKEKLEYNMNKLKWGTMDYAQTIESLNYSEKILSEIDNWEQKILEEKLMGAATKFNLEKGYPEKNRGYLLWPLRVALSAKEASASPFEIADILGKEKTLQRINDAIEALA